MNIQENKHYFIVDLTKRDGDVQSAIASVKQYVTSRYSSVSIGWFVRPDQAPFLNDTDNKRVHNGILSVGDRVSVVKEWLIHLSRNGAAGHMFHVISLDGTVLAEAASLNQSSLVVATHHLTGVLKDKQGGARAFMPRPHPVAFSSAPFSLDEAIALAKRVLTDGSHFSSETALHQPKLRLKMIDLDDRAKRNDADPSSALLIKHIVEDGLQKGWLGQLKHHEMHGFEYIWLKEPNAKLPPHREISTSQVDPPRAETQTHHIGANSTNREPRQEVKAPVQGTNTDKMAKLMQDTLSKKQNRIGSPVVPREFLYEAVEQTVNDLKGQTIQVAELVTIARDKAIGAAAAANYSRPQKWEAISECFQNMLLAAGVLEDENGRPIHDRIGARSSRVAKVVPNYRDRCEALLVECIIKELGSVPYTDWHLLNIGLALYQRGGASPTPRALLVQRADFLCKLLEDEERIEMDGERVMRPHCPKIPTS